MRQMILVSACVTLMCAAVAAQGIESAARLDELLETLESASLDDRPKLLESISKLGDQASKAIPVLVKKLDDDDPETRAGAALAIGQIGRYDEAAVARLLEAFDDTASLASGGRVCYFAAHALGQLGPKSMPLLIPKMSSRDTRVIRCVALSFGEIGSEAHAAVPVLHQLLLREESGVRIAAIYALRAIGPKAAPAMPDLINALASADFHTQYWSCRAIAAIGEPEALAAVPKLIELLATSNPSVRRNAAEALGLIGPTVGDRVIVPLTTLIGDPVHPVRSSGLIALGRLGPLAKPSVPAITAALQKDDFSAKAEAAGALWQVTGKPEPGMSILLTVLQRKNSPWSAAEAFERIGQAAKPAVTKLASLTESENVETRVFAVMALAGIGPAADQAMPVLKKMLQDPDEDMQDLARLAIEKIQPAQ